MNTKQLAEKAQTIVAELEELDNRITELKDGDDAEALETAQSLYEEKNAEFDEVEKSLATAKERDRKRALAQEIAKSVAPVQEPAEKKVSVETTAAQKEKDQLQCFWDFMKYKKMSDNAIDLIKPKSQIDKAEADGLQCAAAPMLVKRALLGDRICKSMGSGGAKVTNTTGSNLIDQEFFAQLQMEAMPVPQVVDRVRVIPTKSGDVEIPTLTQTDGSGKFGGISFSWITEAAAKPDQNATWSKVRIQTHELAGSMQVSERLLSRSMINIEQLLIELSRGDLRYVLDTAIISGTGTGQPLGVINDGIRHIARTALNTVGYQDLVNLVYELPPEDRARAIFVMNDAVEKDLLGDVDSDGKPLYSASTANGIYDRLVGRQFVSNVNSPALGSEGDIIFGDWSAYVLAMEDDIVFARSPHYTLTNYLMTYKAFLVAGGRCVLPRKFVTLTVAAS